MNPSADRPQGKRRRAGIPEASSDEALKRMRSTRQRDTAAELAVRAAVDVLSLSYDVDRCLIPSVRRRADLVFEPEQVAVFIDGCFWHACPDHATWPKANAAWWRAKIEANRQRDADTDRRLLQAGWEVVRVWEHEDPAEAAGRIAQVVRERAFFVKP